MSTDLSEGFQWPAQIVNDHESILSKKQTLYFRIILIYRKVAKIIHSFLHPYPLSSIVNILHNCGTFVTTKNAALVVSRN